MHGLGVSVVAVISEKPPPILADIERLSEVAFPNRSASLIKITTLSDCLRIVSVISIAVYLALFGFVSVTRTGHFELDSMNYVNVARNLLSGKGLSQPTLGCNQRTFSVDAKIPTPFTVQAPLYPILIAFLASTGIATTTSALLLSAISYAATFLLIYKFTDELYDEATAVFAVGVLSIYQPLHRLANYALSDVMAIDFTLLSFWLLVKKSEKGRNWLVFSSGIVAGFAFATRYALLPVFGTNVLLLLINWKGWRRTFLEIWLCTLGFAIPAGVIFGHNLVITGSPVPVLASAHGSLVHALMKTRILFERYLGTRWPHLQEAMFLLSLVAFFGLLVGREQVVATGRYLFSPQRCLPILWSAVCLIFLYVITSRSQQQLERRFFAPIGVTMSIVWAAIAVRASRVSVRTARAVVVALLLFAVVREAVAAKRRSRLDLGLRIQRSERLTWLATHTSDRDLIIGNDAVDISFFLNRPFTVSFSSFRYTSPATYEIVTTYTKRHCDEYQDIYLVLHDGRWTEAQWRFWYGDFFADLASGKLQKYPNIALVQCLQDGSIFHIVCH